MFCVFSQKDQEARNTFHKFRSLSGSEQLMMMFPHFWFRSLCTHVTLTLI